MSSSSEKVYLNPEKTKNNVSNVTRTIVFSRCSASSSGTYNTVALNASAQTLGLRNLPWPETLDHISPASVTVPSHDDLKLELSFLRMASSAVSAGRSKFAEHGMPFGRPLTFFAEMLKSDAHMAKVKDRLLFESKKMSAFKQRKANKEMKGREKEARGNKRMRKDEEKRRGMEEVEAWKKDAERMRGTGVDVDASHAGGGAHRGGDRNFRRENADKKYGHGGKRGKFKKADRKGLDDMSGYNPRGNFKGGMKGGATPSAGGGKRKGKRARDAAKRK